GRIFILMVWDGLRPDLVTEEQTPNLFALAREGVRFDHHHSVYPTLTMVNAAALATGATPEVDGILGNTMYLKPALDTQPDADPELAEQIAHPLSLEKPKLLALLNGPHGFAGHLLGLDTVAQEVEREGGYIAVVGKDGPTFLFDNRVMSVNQGRDSLHMPHENYLFLSDSLVAPEPAGGSAIASAIKSLAVKTLPTAARDALFTRVVTEDAIPAAKAAADRSRPALIVLWQHEPDWAQHRAGLGTLQDLEALEAADANLGRLRAAIAAARIGERTDLMVVSDHGFATMRMKVDLNGLLVKAGLKSSADSTEMVLARNAGSDFIYLSAAKFPTLAQRLAILQKIVKFAEAQEWCGPIFSRDPSIEGTFSQAAVGIFSSRRSPDLMLSFREYPDLDNSGLTGPEHPAFELGLGGERAVRNESKQLVRPVKGLVYADTEGSKYSWTTGMGMHGAAGIRELHNFCAAIGPDFRRRFIDRFPTGNTDVAPTVARIFHLQPNVGPGGACASGRAMYEALPHEARAASSARVTKMTTSLELQGMKVVTTLITTRLGDELYLDDSSVEHIPLGRSP
ncbi:MAG: alkaline phosphatase family protein, partial [Candidatus Binataceae bacterium]